MFMIGVFQGEQDEKTWKTMKIVLEKTVQKQFDGRDSIKGGASHFTKYFQLIFQEAKTFYF